MVPTHPPPPPRQVRGRRVEHAAVTGADGAGGVEHRPRPRRCRPERLGHLLVEALPEQRCGAGADPGCRRTRPGARDGAAPRARSAGGVGPRRGDGHLGAQDAVHQRGLADVGPAHHGRRTPSGRSPSLGAPRLSRRRRGRRGSEARALGACRGEIRTRPIRWPWTRSATSRSPSTSTDSPSTGTLPSTLNSRPPTVSQSPVGELGVEQLVELVDGKAGRTPTPRRRPAL